SMPPDTAVSVLVPRRPPRADPLPYAPLFRALVALVAAVGGWRLGGGDLEHRLGLDGHRRHRAPRFGPIAGLVEEEPPELGVVDRSEEHTSELQSREKLVCRLLLEKKKLLMHH